MQNKIAIIVEGGMVQNILTSDKELEVVIIDYDTERLEDSKITKVPQGKFSTMDGVEKEMWFEDAYVDVMVSEKMEGYMKDFLETV